MTTRCAANAPRVAWRDRADGMHPIIHPSLNPWANDQQLLALYRRRCRQEAEEMTCAAQAADIIGERATVGESLLDAGCGSGYYYYSFLKRTDVEYHGLDYTPEMIDLAHNELCPRTGLPTGRLVYGSIESLDREFDNIVCFNVLTNSPHYALPLGRLLECTKRRLLLRESLGQESMVRYTPDPYLDEGKRHIRVYHNTYRLAEVVEFIKMYGFSVSQIVDRRTKDAVEMVVDIPHSWRILLAERDL